MTTRRRRSLIAGAAVLAAGMMTSPTVAADPGEDPCQLGVTILCHFFPVAPHLEGDVDLTIDAPPADPGAPDPEMSRPSDYY